jgi:hypothetical protein
MENINEYIRIVKKTKERNGVTRQEGFPSCLIRLIPCAEWTAGILSEENGEKCTVNSTHFLQGMSNNDISKRNVVSKTHTTQPIFSEAKLCM